MCVLREGTIREEEGEEGVMPFQAIGKILLVAGGLLVLAGIVMLFGDRIPFLGKLPGDFTFKRDNVTIHFPLMTMIIISVILTIILNLFGRK